MSLTKVHSLLQSLKSLKIDHRSAEESYLNKIIKEAGNEFLHYLLQNALAREDARTWSYKDIEKFCLSSPKDYKLWRAAMEDEFKSLENRKIWDLVELPKGHDPVKCHCVYDIKSDGRKKARLVAKGFSQ